MEQVHLECDYMGFCGFCVPIKKGCAVRLVVLGVYKKEQGLLEVEGGGVGSVRERHVLFVRGPLEI